MKQVRMVAAVLALAMVLALVGCGTTGESPAALTKIQLNEVTHSVFYAPQYAAMELGYFAEEGIELDLINGGGADKVMTAVLTGGSEIGLAGPEATIYVYNEGRDDYCTVFAQLTKRDGAFLVGRTAEPDFRWESLAGRYVIGGRAGGVPLMTLEYLLRSKGLTPNVDLTVDSSIQFNVMAGAFTGGTGDYVALFEPTASLLENEGKGFILASIGQEAGEIPYTAYFSTKSYVEANPEIIEGFTRAVYRGLKWVAENDAATIAGIIAPHFPDTDLDLLTKVTQRHKDIDAWNATPFMTEAAFDKLQEVMTQAGELSQKADYNKLIDNSFATKVTAE